MVYRTNNKENLTKRRMKDALLGNEFNQEEIEKNLNH